MQWLGTAFDGATVRASDGRLGQLEDMLFDDQTWRACWLAVDAGRWLRGRRVLVYPGALARPEIDSAVLSVELTRSQVRDRTAFGNDEPISARMECSLLCYYGSDPDRCHAGRR
jgi:hypothetical protein